MDAGNARNVAVDTEPLDEASCLLRLIDLAHGKSTPSDSGRTSHPAAPQPSQTSGSNTPNSIRLPGLSALFPAFSSGRPDEPYPTPSPSAAVSPPNNDRAKYVSPYASPEWYAINTYFQAVQRGFSFHLKCNRHAFVAYNDKQVGQLLVEFQASVAESRPLASSRACELFSASAIAAVFNRVEIPAGVSDVFYRAASERVGDWVLDQPLAAMRSCALLGLVNLFQKATISVLYFDLALALANRHWATLGADSFDMSCAEHVELQQIWRSLVFGRAWLQSTIGACTTDALLWLPPLNVETDKASAISAEARALLLIPIEIARVSVIAAMAMRVLSACSTTLELLPAVQNLLDHISVWHDDLPAAAKASELTRTPWTESQVALAYVHLSHLGAITLIFRRTLSMYKHRPKGQKDPLHPAERSRLVAIFNDGLVAATQASHILHIFLGEQAGIRHCWMVIYTAFVSAAILLYSISQMQIHNAPEAEWRRYMSFVDNDMEVLAYCQDLDPVATRLRDTLSQYMQFLRVPSLAPKRKAPATWARAALQPPMKTPRDQPEPPQTPDLVDLLLSAPTGRAGPIQTSADLLKLVCQPFNDTEEHPHPRSSRSSSLTTANTASGSNVSGYTVPRVLGEIRHDSAPREKWGRQATNARLPFGWQQCQSSTAFTGRSSTLALTMAQQEMMRAGV